MPPPTMIRVPLGAIVAKAGPLVAIGFWVNATQATKNNNMARVQIG